MRRISSIRSNGLAPQQAAAADAEEAVHRPLVVALADETLHEFEAVDVASAKYGWIPCWTRRLMFSR